MTECFMCCCLFALWDLSGSFWTQFEIGTIFFFFLFFLHAWSHVVHICKPSSCNFSSRRALYANCAAKKISGWPLEYWAVELSWEIWFKWVALISCGNLLGTREKKIFWRSVFKFIIWETLFSPCNKNLRDSVKGCDEGGGLLCLEIQRVWNATGVDRWACAQMRFRSVW